MSLHQVCPALVFLDSTIDRDVFNSKHRNKLQMFHSNQTVTRSQQRLSPLRTSTEDRDIAAQSKVAEYIKVPGLN